MDPQKALLTLKPLRQKAYLLALLPLVPALLISIALWPIKGIFAADATILGGLVWALPNVLAAHFIFKNVSPRASKKILTTLYVTEIIKLLLIVILCLVISHFFDVMLGYVLLGYSIAMVAFWFMPLLILK